MEINFIVYILQNFNRYIYKINNLDKTKLIYDNKINLFDIGYDRIYK